MKNHANCSQHACTADTDIRKITKVLGIIVVFMLLELWGHHRTHSLSLLADSLHLLVDISGLLVSIVTLRIAKRRETRKMTFGFQRVEIIGALISVMLIWAAVLYLVVESFHKYFHPEEIDSFTFLLIALIGLGVNIGCIFILHKDQYKHNVNDKNLNIRATYVHVLGDIIQSVGVIIASLIIYFYPKLVIADIICTLLFALLVLVSTVYILKDALRILAEGAPGDIDQNAIRNHVLQHEAVVRIEEMRLWSISVNRHAIILRLLTDHIMMGEYESIVQEIVEYVKKKGVEFVYVQLETPNMAGNNIGLHVAA